MLLHRREPPIGRRRFTLCVIIIDDNVADTDANLWDIGIANDRPTIKLRPRRFRNSARNPSRSLKALGISRIN
jgi:hypothetical protein